MQFLKRYKVMKINRSKLFSISFLIIGVVLIGKAFYMDAKAELAQYLINSAWQTHEEGQPAKKPWPWADTYAVAKIEVPRLNVVQYIMRDASGESLAFGPGHLTKSALPASTGHTMIAGHRDSHFEFIKNLTMGDIVIVSNYHNDRQFYRVSKAVEFDTRSEQLNLTSQDKLTLITCYPFNELTPGGPLRWIVDAIPIPNTEVASITQKKQPV